MHGYLHVPPSCLSECKLQILKGNTDYERTRNPSTVWHMQPIFSNTSCVFFCDLTSIVIRDGKHELFYCGIKNPENIPSQVVLWQINLTLSSPHFTKTKSQRTIWLHSGLFLLSLIFPHLQNKSMYSKLFKGFQDKCTGEEIIINQIRKEKIWHINPLKWQLYIVKSMYKCTFLGSKRVKRNMLRVGVFHSDWSCHKYSY